MRRSRGNPGSSRSDSTHILTDVKCVGSSRSRSRVPGPRSSGSSATTMGNSRIALKPTAIAPSIGVAPRPSEEIEDHLGRRGPYEDRRQRQPPRRKAIVMGERTHADISAREHQEEQRGPRRFHPAEEGSRRRIEGAGRGHEKRLSCLIAPPRAQPAGPACGTREMRRPGVKARPCLLVLEAKLQTFASGTFGTVLRLALGRGDERRLALGRTAGSFSGFGVTGPSRNSKPSLSRPASSLLTTTRT